MAGILVYEEGPDRGAETPRAFERLNKPYVARVPSPWVPRPAGDPVGDPRRNLPGKAKSLMITVWRAGLSYRCLDVARLARGAPGTGRPSTGAGESVPVLGDEFDFSRLPYCSCHACLLGRLGGAARDTIMDLNRGGGFL